MKLIKRHTKAAIGIACGLTMIYVLNQLYTLVLYGQTSTLIRTTLSQDIASIDQSGNGLLWMLSALSLIAGGVVTGRIIKKRGLIYGAITGVVSLLLSFAVIFLISIFRHAVFPAGVSQALIDQKISAQYIQSLINAPYLILLTAMGGWIGEYASYKKISIKKFIKLLFLSIVIFVFIMVVAVLILIDNGARNIVKHNQKSVTRNEKRLQYIFSDIFPRARECAGDNPTPTTFDAYKDHCDGEIRSLIDSKFDDILDYCNILSWENCEHGRRQPAYFIKLQDETHIEKLFQSGTYFVETVDTPEERKVVRMLQGRTNPFPFPLYTCCGGGDVPENFPLLPTRLYLKDFYSELELIFPIKNDHGEIMGAFVKLHGD